MALSQSHYPRPCKDTKSLSKCADYIREGLPDTGGHLPDQVYSSMAYSFESVILILPGTHDSRIAIGAHYDAYGDTDLLVYSASNSNFVPASDFLNHKNYWKYGYPDVMITNTAFYKKSNYHDPDDTATPWMMNRCRKLWKNFKKQPEG